MKNNKIEIVTVILSTFISLSAYPQQTINTKSDPGNLILAHSPERKVYPASPRSSSNENSLIGKKADKERYLSNDTSTLYYHRMHYWDTVNFLVPQMIHSSLLTEKLNSYFREILPQQPDTVICYMKALLYKKMADPVKHAVLDFLLQYTSESKAMEMEKAFIWLTGNYYLFGCDWLPEKTLETIKRQYTYNQSCFVGSKAFNLWMETDEGTSFQLYQLQSDYVLLLFYDITSDGSKDLVKELVSDAPALSRAGVEIVAVNTETDQDKWKKFIRQEAIPQWHHVTDRQNRTNFQVLYGVQETPMLYLLDKEKNIIGKKLTMKKVFEILDKKAPVCSEIVY